MVERLRDEVVRAFAKRPDGEVGPVRARDQDRRRSRPCLPDLFEQCEVVHPGHPDVGHDRVVIDFLDPFERIRACLGGVDSDSFHAEQDRLRQRLEQRDVFVDEQDPRVAHRSGSGTVSLELDRSFLATGLPSLEVLFVENGGAAFSFCALSLSPAIGCSARLQAISTAIWPNLTKSMLSGRRDPSFGAAKWNMNGLQSVLFHCEGGDPFGSRHALREGGDFFEADTS